MSEDRYTRIYWRFADEYPDVWNDDWALALWTRLVRLADMAWPAAATLPYGIKKAALARLTVDREGGPLVVMVTPSTFRVRGMDKHRAQRSQSGRDAAEARWRNADGNAKRNATGNANSIAERNAETMPNKAKQNRAEQSRAEQEDARAPDAAEALYQRTGEYPSVKVLGWLNDLASEAGGGDVDVGEAKVAELIDRTPMTGNRRDYLGRIRDLIRAENHAAEKREAAEERQRLAEKRAPVRPLRAMPTTQTEEEAELEVAAFRAEFGRAGA